VKRLVLFDLDGTLIDTTELILQSFAHAFERHLPGRLPVRADLIATFGRSLPAALLELAILNGAADPQALADEMLVTYRDFQRVHHDTLIQSFEGIPPLLDGLSSRGYRLGVVTSKMQHFARHGMRLFDLEKYFDVAVFHDDVTRHKPDPEPLLEAARRAGVPGSEAVYIGDSIHDVVAGRAAGMTTVAVLWGPFDAEVLEAVTPDHIVTTPDALLRLLTGDVDRPETLRG
jgi:pyrophosphatase PpaX